MRLFEVLSRPYPWEIVLRDDDEIRAKFETDAGPCLVKLEKDDDDYEGDALWSLAFTVKHSYEATGANDAFRVLSTVGEISLEMIKQVRPRVFYFHAWEDEVSRVKLYHKLARIIASRANYTLHTETSSLSTRFFFRRGDIG